MTRIAACTVGIAAWMAAVNAMAEVEADWGAFVENDLRFAVDRVDTPGVSRNQTAMGLDLNAELLPDRLRFVGNLQFAWTGFSRDTEFEGLTTRSEVSPYYLESNAAYIEVVSILPGLDLRVGRQVVHWGAADMFNPTDNLNALDLEDPLKFGEAIANEMIRLDWAPNDNFVLTAVLVPVFQPAQLPSSALLALGDPSISEFPFEDPAKRHEGERLRYMWLSNPDRFRLEEPDVTAVMPETSLENMQFGLRLQWMSGLFDMSVSYYQGFDDIPKPAASVATAEYEYTETGELAIVSTDVELVYPRQKVVGFDFSGEIPFLDSAGFWFEGAYVFPEAVASVVDVTEVVTTSRPIEGESVSDTPYFKFTTGMDYSVNQYLFVTGQFIRGFVDEFGAHWINDYWVGGFDVKLFSEMLLLRLFCVGELPHEDDDIELDEDGDGLVDSPAIGSHDDGTITSYVIFPSATVKPMDGLELALGGYFLLGHQESALARAAAGPSLVFFRARASF